MNKPKSSSTESLGASFVSSVHSSPVVRTTSVLYTCIVLVELVLGCCAAMVPAFNFHITRALGSIRHRSSSPSAELSRKWAHSYLPTAWIGANFQSASASGAVLALTGCTTWTCQCGFTQHPHKEQCLPSCHNTAATTNTTKTGNTCAITNPDTTCCAPPPPPFPPQPPAGRTTSAQLVS